MKFSWWKLIVGFLFYLFFHQIYDWMPNTLGAILGESIGSVYAHMEMLFYSYIVVSMIDYVRNRNEIDLEKFLYARMLILVSVPWMMIIVYYAVEALGITLPHAMAIVWGIITTLLGLYFAIQLEEPFESMHLSSSVKGIIILSFLTALITYVGFSFEVPHNFFEASH